MKPRLTLTGQSPRLLLTSLHEYYGRVHILALIALFLGLFAGFRSL